MNEVQQIIDYLFSTKAGLACLIVGSVLISCVVAALMERHTKKRFPDYSDAESDDDTSS